MATLAELNSLMNEPTLNTKIRGAVISAAVAVKHEAADTANHADRLLWAKQALNDPVGTAADVQRYVVAARNADQPSLTEAQIIGMSDVDIQNYTNASINIFATGA